MPTPGLEHLKKRRWLSISSLNTAARCPRLFFYKSGIRLRGGGRSAPLVFGEAVHAAAPWSLQGETDKAMEEFDKAWDDSLDDKAHSRENARRMLEDFWHTHSGGKGLYEIMNPPQGLIDMGEKKSPFEIPFAIDIGLPIPLVGFIDWLGQYRDRDMVIPVDLKTTSELSDRVFSSFQRNPQICAYILAVRYITGDDKVDRMIIEFMRKSGAKQQAVETISQVFQVTEDDLADFIEWARYWGTQILAWEETGEFPKNINACTPYPSFGSHGYICDCHTLCMVRDWTMMLDSYEIGEERDFALDLLPTLETVEE